MSSPIPPTQTSRDRTVHGKTADGGEIVRYDRAGKWYVEWPTNRYQVSLREAARLASMPGASAFLGRSGGLRFDAAMRGDG